MYWTKIATAENEFDQIAALNYETFVEEIPQHKENHTHRLVDRFHHENTYIVVYKETELVGMIAFRAVRPFSLDEKIGPVEQHLSTEHCTNLCELRLLAVKKQYRNGRVMLRLFKALYAYFYEQNFSACVISGTTRQEKLYKQIGFTQFAPAVGTKDAQYLPMVITKEAIDSFRGRMLKELKTFYPGPVKQTTGLMHTATSHRSMDGVSLYVDVKEQLLKLADCRFVATIVGSGTVANEVMFGMVKSVFPKQQGLIVSNGEFGERLIYQAKHWELTFVEKTYDWGAAFNLAEIEAMFIENDIRWLAFVHGETSTGTCNPLHNLIQLCQKYNVKLCVDCISSFGTYPFSLKDVFCATAVSGKAIGALGGLSFVFYNDEPAEIEGIPSYVNLATYHNYMPFTVPVFLLANTLAALEQYPARFEVLQQRLQLMLNSSIYLKYGLQTAHYPIIVTFVGVNDFYTCTRLNDFDLHGASAYLKQRDYVQLSMIQPTFEKDFAALERLFANYTKLT